MKGEEGVVALCELSEGLAYVKRRRNKNPFFTTCQFFFTISFAVHMALRTGYVFSKDVLT